MKKRIYTFAWPSARAGAIMDSVPNTTNSPLTLSQNNQTYLTSIVKNNSGNRTAWVSDYE